MIRIRKPSSESAYKLLLRIDCASVGLPEPEEEIVFLKEREWRFDLGWSADKVSIEIQGGGFMRPLYFHPATQTHHLTKLPGARCVTVKVKSGKTWVPRLGGEHHNADKMDDENTKHNVATLAGWRVFAFSTRQIDRGEHVPTLKLIVPLVTKTKTARLF